MSTEPTISSAYFRLILDGIESLGLKPEKLLESAGIDQKVIEDPDGRIPRHRTARVWLEAASLLDDRDMGLHIAEQLVPRAFNAAVYLAMSSRTLREGLERMFRYQRLFGTGSRLALGYREAGAFLQMEFGTDDQPPTRHQVEHTAVVLLKYCQWFIEEPFNFVEVHFKHPQPDDISEHERIFQCPLFFDAHISGLLIGSKELDRSSIHAEPRLARAHEEFAAESLRELGDESFAREVEASLTPILELGRLELKNAAERLQLSPRTLQRRLTEEGTNYREVVDNLRRRVTLRHLSRAGLPIEEIVYLAGFSDLSAFYRAFKRWTGMTPSEYRVLPVVTQASES